MVEVRSLGSRRKNLSKLHNLSCFVLVIYSLKFSTVHRLVARLQGYKMLQARDERSPQTIDIVK